MINSNIIADAKITRLIQRVQDFHAAFGIEENLEFGTIDPTTAGLRYKLLQEENSEYLNAVAAGDEVEIADALTDMLYILLGTMAIHGFKDLAVGCFKEVHRSNMSKLDENGKPIYREDGKILKSARYEAPNLRKILITYQRQKQGGK